jgi:hypothetical protein
MKIVKQSGLVVPFNRNKLRASLLRSGASIEAASDILASIEKNIYDGMTTRKIYKLAYALLKKVPGSVAARYNLRTAIQQLGPAGFFFEKFIARIFESDGYKTMSNVTLKGKCVSHEVDVVIEKNNKTTLVECKFHSRRESVSDVKVPMYIFSRFNDLKAQPNNIFRPHNILSNCLIVTNNRFTDDAHTFSRCSSLQLLSWDYPEKQGLRDLIDTGKHYPTTCLTTLTAFEKEQLLILDLLMASDLKTQADQLVKIGLSPNRIKNILFEVTELCK